MRQLKIVKRITNRSADSLDTYLQEISKLDMIDAEEEIRLAQRIKKGDDDALKELVKANLRFVVSVAKQYQGNGLSLSELINEGNIGLVKAAKKFDETRGFKFISYAVWWIRQSILQGLAENSRVVRLPLNKISLVTQVLKAHEEFLQDNERDPTADEIAQIKGLAEKMVSEAYMIAQRDIPGDAPVDVDDGNETSLFDLLVHTKPETFDESESLKKDVERALDKLTDREAYIIRKCFGIGCTQMALEDIGEELDLSRERVRQIKEKAVRRLRKSHTKSFLKKYL
jgi:RNA polymerase primary sigma factor